MLNFIYLLDMLEIMLQKFCFNKKYKIFIIW